MFIIIFTATATEFSVTLSWMPGYSGGPDYKQDYTIWYREAGISDWSTIPVTPSGSTQVTINRLSPGTTYEFQVIGKNPLGDGMMSKTMTIRTLGKLLMENFSKHKKKLNLHKKKLSLKIFLLMESKKKRNFLFIAANSHSCYLFFLSFPSTKTKNKNFCALIRFWKIMFKK